MSTATAAQKRLGSLLGPDAELLVPPLGEEVIFDLCDLVATFKKPAVDGMAATATTPVKGLLAADTIQGGFANPFDFDLLVVGMTITPQAALTADNTNFATISVETDDAAGTASVPALGLATTIALPGSGNWVANVPQIVTIAQNGTKGILGAAGQRLRAGANLFASITKTAAGVVVPVFGMTVRLRRL